MTRQLSENAANSRTLIMGLVVALAVMVPLRFFQAGQELAEAEVELEVQARLAEYQALRLANINRAADRAVALSESQTAVLGVSDFANSGACITPENATNLVTSLYETISANGKEPSAEELNSYMYQLSEIESRICQ